MDVNRFKTDLTKYFNPPATVKDVTCPFFDGEDAKAKKIYCRGPTIGRICLDFPSSGEHYKHFVNHCVCRYWMCRINMLFRINILQSRAKENIPTQTSPDDRSASGLLEDDEP